MVMENKLELNQLKTTQESKQLGLTHLINPWTIHLPWVNKLSKKHILLILFVMFLLGSAYPTAKLGLNASLPPILFGAIRMAIVFIFLIPFCKIEFPKKNTYFRC